ncbi:hypothetical protein DNTS_030950 [Danionella cerebrum]|uniref:Purine nucleoside phosphorylase LACC1 n=2 Tax=Danionella cerebrum TaxID=2873325 RepID=A0A553MXP9_9TELE|nr:hypothetical protein DNTS_030950 [Danionella translucida]TRY57959.1 hypothetical protein DNTS_030950 [Danionella translucida]
MAAGIVLDLTRVCSEACAEQRIRALGTPSENGSRSPVFLLAEAGSGAGTPGLLSSSQLRVLRESSLAASLYALKRALDEEDVRTVRIVTSSRGRGVLQLYRELLFTAAYAFHYALVSCDSCRLRQPPCVSAPDDDVRHELSAFLQRLPAVRGEVKVLKSALVSDCFGHGFSTRTGGISYIPTLSSLNLFCNPRRKDPRSVVSENLRRLGKQAGFHPQDFNLIKCNHASDVWVMGKPAPDSYDGMVTNRPGVVIAAPGADCMPMLFTDPVAKVIGVAHAGWKGTLMGIAMATVKAMVTEFGSKPADVVCVIGPSVGPCCFTLEQDSAREFWAIHPDCVRNPESPEPHVDIRRATRILLERGGVKAEHIEELRIPHETSSSLCTSCQPELFFSRVRDGINFGTQVGFVWIK